MGRLHRFVDTAAYCTAMVGPLVVCGAFIATTQSHRAAEVLTLDTVTEAAEAAMPLPTIPSVPASKDIPVPDAPSGPAEPVAGQMDFAFVTGGQLLVHADASMAWVSAKVKTPSAGGSIGDFLAVDVPANPSLLPEHLAALIGSSVDLYGARGKVCTTTISDLRVQAERNGEEDELTVGLDVDYEEWTIDAENARVLMQRVLKQEDRWLVANAETTDGGACKGALFGRASSLPAPLLLAASRRNWRDVPAASRSAFKRLATTTLAEDFELYLDQVSVPSWESWDTFYDDTIRYTVFVDGNGAPVLARALMGDTESTCGGDFGGQLNRYYALREGYVAPRTGPNMPVLLVDIDGDGRFEIIADDGEGRVLYDADGGHLQSGFRPYMGCPC